MSDNSKIEWTEASWNPVTGCTEVSPGCDNCYAKTFAERWRGVPGHHFEQGFDVVLRPERLGQPLRWTKPRRIFVNSMSDLFHQAVPDRFIAEVFAVMALASRHTFQLLTKRHGRMRSLLNSSAFRIRVLDAAHLVASGEVSGVTVPRPTARDYWTRKEQALNGDRDSVITWPLPNVWLGVSVEDQQWADIRIPALLQTPAAVRWLSCEPLLGPVDLDQPRCEHHDRDEVYADETGQEWCNDCIADGSTGELSYGHWLDPLNGGIGWVVAGGESGPSARPMHPGWARTLRDQCIAAGVPFFFKQWGEWAPNGYRGIGNNINPRERLVGPELDKMGHREVIERLGKKRAGRELDGRTWDEYPTARVSV